MAHIIVIKGEDQRSLPLTQDQVTIGRADDNDIVLDDMKVSRNHCAFKCTDGVYSVIDLESRNGTKVNGELARERKLVDGDQVRLGDHTLVIEGLGEEEPKEEEVQEAVPVKGPAPRLRKGFRRPFRPNRLLTRNERRRKTQILAPVDEKGEPRAKPPVPVTPPPKEEKKPADVVVINKTPPIKINLPAKPEPEPAPQPKIESVEKTKVFTAESKIVSKPQAIPEKATGSKPAPAVHSITSIPWRASLKKFCLVDGNAVRLFVRSNGSATTSASGLPVTQILSAQPDTLPLEEVFKIEGAHPDKEFDRTARSVLLSVLSDDDDNRESSILLDTAGIVSIVESAPQDDEKAVRRLIGRGIELVAMLATETSAQKLLQDGKQFWSKRGQKLDDLLSARFGKAPSPAFWKKVDANLKEGRLRMVYVIPEATVTVQRVIDFLHSKTSLSAYGLQLDIYTESGAEKPRIAFTSKLLEPSKSARTAKTAKEPEHEEETSSSANDLVGAPES